MEKTLPFPKTRSKKEQRHWQNVSSTLISERYQNSFGRTKAKSLSSLSALAMGQRIILLDEPLCNLDKESAVNLLELLRNLTREGYTVVLFEHRLDIVLPFVDAVYCIKNKESNASKISFLSGRWKTDPSLPPKRICRRKENCSPLAA